MNLQHIDVVQLAFQAGIRVASTSDIVDPRNVYIHELMRFAAFVAAAQREFDAQLVDDNAMACEKPGPRSMLQANADEIRNGGPIDDWKDEL
jgi:hypothetical protein